MVLGDLVPKGGIITLRCLKVNLLRSKVIIRVGMQYILVKQGSRTVEPTVFLKIRGKSFKTSSKKTTPILYKRKCFTKLQTPRKCKQKKHGFLIILVLHLGLFQASLSSWCSK